MLAEHDTLPFDLHDLGSFAEPLTLFVLTTVDEHESLHRLVAVAEQFELERRNVNALRQQRGEAG